MKQWHIEAGGPVHGYFSHQDEDIYYINDSDGETVAMCKDKADAESVVRDHNAGPELLAACEAAVIEVACANGPCAGCIADEKCEYPQALSYRQLTAAIANAKGDQ